MYPSFIKNYNESIISLNNYVNESLLNNSPKANVRHQHPTEDSNEKCKINRGELSEHIRVNKVLLALSRLKYFNAPRKIEKALLQGREKNA